jgi:hypothetical protein
MNETARISAIADVQGKNRQIANGTCLESNSATQLYCFLMRLFSAIREGVWAEDAIYGSGGIDL